MGTEEYHKNTIEKRQERKRALEEVGRTKLKYFNVPTSYTANIKLLDKTLKTNS